MSTFDDVLHLYRSRVGSSRFDKRLETQPEPLRAEAAVFKFLTDQGLSPQIHEDPSLGGVDFECELGSTFSVEVTTLTSAVLGKRSGVRPDVMEAGVIDLQQVVALIRSRVSEKGTNWQARSYPGPRVLAIVSEHYMARIFFLAAAPELLTGRSKVAWRVGPDGPIGESFIMTEMKDAAHIRTGTGGDVEVFRPKHALILLLAAHQAGCEIVAIANPQPSEQLPEGAFLAVPTMQLAWPVRGDHLQSGWSQEDRPLRYSFS